MAPEANRAWSLAALAEAQGRLGVCPSIAFGR
jgi:hypothetical protein